MDITVGIVVAHMVDDAVIVLGFKRPRIEWADGKEPGNFGIAGGIGRIDIDVDGRMPARLGNSSSL